MRNTNGLIRRVRLAVATIAAMALPFAGGSSSLTAAGGPRVNAFQAKAAMIHASGTFEVTMTPQAGDESALGRFAIDKAFHGDLEGTSKGQMLAAGTDVEGSAGYVAMERVTAALAGRAGTFVLQHSGTMTRGAQQLTISVVPDSGTGQLTGLAGTMTITITDKKHFYGFDYTLPEAR